MVLLILVVGRATVLVTVLQQASLGSWGCWPPGVKWSGYEVAAFKRRWLKIGLCREMLLWEEQLSTILGCGGVGGRLMSIFFGLIDVPNAMFAMPFKMSVRLSCRVMQTLSWH
jgi:hypothetical protein